MLVIVEVRMQQGDNPEQKEDDSDDEESAFHDADLITNSRIMAGDANGHTPAPNWRGDSSDFGCEEKKGLRTACGGSSSGFLGSLGSS